MGVGRSHEAAHEIALLEPQPAAFEDLQLDL